MNKIAVTAGVVWLCSGITLLVMLLTWNITGLVIVGGINVLSMFVFAAFGPAGSSAGPTRDEQIDQSFAMSRRIQR